MQPRSGRERFISLYSHSLALSLSLSRAREPAPFAYVHLPSLKDEGGERGGKRAVQGWISSLAAGSEANA